MDIGILINDISIFGGVERVISTIANELSNKDKYKIKIISLYEPRNKERLFELNSNIEVIYLNYKDKRSGNIAICYDTYKFIKKSLKNIKLDLIIGLNTYNNIYLALIKKRLKLRVIAWHHEDYFNDTNKWNLLKKIMYKRIDRVILLTERDKKEYEKFCANCIVIPNPSPFDSEYLFNINSKKILSLGRLSVEKSFEYMIKAFKLIKYEFKDWSLEIVGDGPEKNKLLGLIKELELEDQVYISNFTNNVKKKYSEAAFTVLTSQKEGLPMMLIESKSFGIPSISFDVRTGPREIINHEIDGYLVEANNIQKLSEYMKKIMLDNDKRKQMSVKAYCESEKYSLEKIANIWEGIIG